ncbi:D-amino acid aminotransferase [Propionivibrio soli]|uniref:D-amino acid aminotransferase n=1 Tax=Propionivibrio soli TaxID=2976531 RepID=UPI0021E873F8|nr:D-amino acid aminotransferase [Propionivibrio soli]
MMAYLNGAFMPLAEARISPLDRGFLYADGVYEVIPVYSRCPFRLDEHLRRMQASLDGIRLKNPHSADEWRSIIRRLVTSADYVDQTVYIQITRGADVRRDACFPLHAQPTVFLFTSPLVGPTPAQRESGVAAITQPDIRWGRCDLKTLALLPNVLMRQLAADAGCAETIMLRDGFLTEASTSNVFVVKGGVILTPPKDHRVLPGITYDVVLELAAKHQAPYEVRPVSEAELRSADELWLTASTKEVLAITTLDGKPVGNGPNAGRPGPLGRQMYAWYSDFREEVMRHAET